MAVPEQPRQDSLPLTLTGDKAYQAYKLHQAGEDWEQVASILGYANARTAQVSVRTYIQRAAAEMDEQRREEVLSLELSRLDALQAALWDKAMLGDTKSVDSILRVMTSRAKLLGLDLTPTTNVTSKTVVIQGSTEDFIKALQEA